MTFMHLSIDKICPKSHLSLPKTPANRGRTLSCQCILTVLLYHHTGQLQSTLYYIKYYTKHLGKNYWENINCDVHSSRGASLGTLSSLSENNYHVYICCSQILLTGASKKTVKLQNLTLALQNSGVAVIKENESNVKNAVSHIKIPLNSWLKFLHLIKYCVFYHIIL